jgi:hypothetical protein
MQMLNVDVESPPHIRFFFLCDGLIYRDDGQIDVTRLVTNHVFTGPSSQMPSCKLKVTFVVGIYSDNHQITYPLRFTGQDVGKPEMPFFKSQIGLVDNQYTSLMVRRCDLEFAQPGTYWFNLYLDCNLVGRYPLEITYVTGNL